jgi:hypothetical protein
MQLDNETAILLSLLKQQLWKCARLRTWRVMTVP